MAFDVLWQLIQSYFEGLAFKIEPEARVMKWNTPSQGIQGWEPLSVIMLYLNYLHWFKESVQEALEYVF